MPPIPTPAEMDELTAFLPRLYKPGFQPILRWDGGGKDERGVISLPWPVYDPIVEEFYRVLSKGCWADYNYEPAVAGQMLRDPAQVAKASIEEIQSMLTFCNRGERFSTGHWGAMIEQGYVRRLLERIAELRGTAAA